MRSFAAAFLVPCWRYPPISKNNCDNRYAERVKVLVETLLATNNTPRSVTLSARYELKVSTCEFLR